MERELDGQIAIRILNARLREEALKIDCGDRCYSTAGAEPQLASDNPAAGIGPECSEAAIEIAGGRIPVVVDSCVGNGAIRHQLERPAADAAQRHAAGETAGVDDP